MRSVRAAGLLVIVLVIAVGCGEPPERGAQAADLLYFSTGKGVAVVPAGGEAAPPTTRGVPSTDWSSVVTSDPHRLATEVEARDAITGDTQWRKAIKGPRLRVKVVSHEARMVALTPLYQQHYTTGRTATTLVVAGSDVEPRTIELDGNYEPEAFSTDGNSVFLLEYLPPQAPTSYRVRRLDLATEKVEGVYSVDAELQEAMRGTARVQAMSPNGKFLYTLYTTGGGNLGPRRAFVHVLNLDELWAHCIDLPADFGQAREPQIAINVTPDSKRLYVTDSASAAIAEVDTESLEVLQTKTTALLTSQYTPIAAHDGRHTLYVAQGPFVYPVDTRDMVAGDRWALDGAISGVQVSADATKLYASVAGKLVTIDVTTGAERRVDTPPGVGRITEVGRVMQRIEDPLRKLTCAC
ncbi:MAG: YncE family protein [Actinomycetota bacterium]